MLEQTKPTCFFLNKLTQNTSANSPQRLPSYHCLAIRLIRYHVALQKNLRILTQGCDLFHFPQ